MRGSDNGLAGFTNSPIRVAAAGTILMFDLAYFGGLHVSGLVSLIWGQVIRRDSGRAQLSSVGKGSKSREVRISAVIAAWLFASCGDAPASAPSSGNDPIARA
jgi:site-specific recombinase XerC